jgi:hypothetical protein
MVHTFSSKDSSLSCCFAVNLALFSSSIFRGGLFGGENSVSGVVFELFDSVSMAFVRAVIFTGAWCWK